MAIHTILTLKKNIPIADTTIVFGRKSMLKSEKLRKELGVNAETWNAILGRHRPGDMGTSAVTWVGAKKIVIGILPESCSRHNSPSRSWAIAPIVNQGSSGSSELSIIAMIEEAHAEATAMAVARGLHTYSSSSKTKKNEACLELRTENGSVDDPKIQLMMDAVRYASKLVDMPTCELNVNAFVADANRVAEKTGSKITVIQGKELKAQGFGGIWGVGKAARELPAMVKLEWRVEDSNRSVAWIGKGIVYDTGGLSIKSKTGMPGMKGDMGGAAAVIAAFEAAASMKVPYNLTAILCLAENAVGPDSVSPDDILVMKSGKTVEVNNTDAEGRLVLADGVAWASAETDAAMIVDVATLTGAAPMSVGKNFAALYCNDEELERAAVRAGKEAGEPCHPLPYVPEFFRQEFSSRIADMKNSVKNRANGQSACAGQFIGNHLPKEAPLWLHVDIAGPAWDRNKRGTGYGVGLLLTLGAGPLLF